MPKKSDTVLADILIDKALITEAVLEPFLKEVERSGDSLQQVLVKSRLFLEKDILNILADKFKIAYLDLRTLSIEKKVLDKVPVKIASYYKFIPIEIKDLTLTIAVAAPLDIKMQDEIRTQLGFHIETVLACSADILEGLKKYYGLAADTLGQMTSQISMPSTLSKETTQEKVEDIEKLAGDASVIKLVNQIILEAYRKRATDIHIEPSREKMGLRYRIDGLLYDANVMPETRNFMNAIISRIKIMSNLNIVERRLPQDGRAIVRVQDQMLDLRISTIPTPFGESVVIRLLPTQMLFSLEKLGLAKRELQIFEKLIQKPHGVVFVTGPTGSGKTTTLYACLSRINTKDRKIITLEDPIEYEMSGITQIQMMPEIKLDFARGLRSVLRHDPDVIMVGEVRDLETAEIGIRVALTGHLVFSTLHTNDAASGITRLLDIGVEPFLLASSVEAFIAQRLIRLICSECKYEDKDAPQELKDLIARDLAIKSTEVNIFRGKGCAQCNFTGFIGRSAIYEILLVDQVIKDLIIKKAFSDQIKKIAIARGMRTLRQDGWQKVISGLATPEEVMKVSSQEERPSEAEREAPIFSSALVNENVFPLRLERRLYQRLNSKINLGYKVYDLNDDLLKRGSRPEHHSVTKNISAGGLLFYAKEPLPIGSILLLRIALLDGKEPIECLVRIVKIDEIEEGKNYNVAVCFLDISGAEKTRLDKYMETAP